SVVAEMSSGQETSTLHESVRFTQQLALFGPQAVSMHAHVRTLLLTLLQDRKHQYMYVENSRTKPTLNIFPSQPMDVEPSPKREGNHKGPTSSSEHEGPKTPDPKV
ncbi:hypothetical protein FRX31_013193, partial [Thalictrum thalictroides]